MIHDPATSRFRMPVNTQRLRSPEERMKFFLREASVLRKTESGGHIIGLIVPTHPWIYWSQTENKVGCERCGTTHPTPETMEPLVLMGNYLIPFGNEHKPCIKKENP